ncbi:MAG: hypothetical protein IKH33_03425 [Bacteroidales bacterium]|nr:hypothetical protein [Bacteroidales bacterium]
MSENTTKIKSEQYIAITDEIERLRSGEASKRVMDQAVNRAQAIFKQIQDGIGQTDQHISEQRKHHINTLHEIERRGIKKYNQIVGDINQVASSVQLLQEQIDRSTRHVADITNQIAANYSDAEQLYQQIQIEFSIAKSDVDYQRFASQRLLNVDAALHQATSVEMNPLAKRARLQSAMTDLLLSDSEVTSARIRFYDTLNEALELSNTMLSDAAGHRNNTFVFGDEKHHASNIDYWTDGQYKLIEDELNEIRRRLESANLQPSYSMQQLQSDLTRLVELKKMQELQAASTVSEIKLSILRHQQADFIRDILSSDYYFQVITEGFVHNDERESYILRMLRQSDKAIVEIIVSPGKEQGDVHTLVRVDSGAYIDQKLLDTLEKEILEDLRASGMTVTSSAPCNPESIDINSPLEINDETSRRHSIQRRQHTINP